MDREKLLNDLSSFGPVSDAAATALADRGDREALPATLGAVRGSAG